jgi:hypothetical protein
MAEAVGHGRQGAHRMQLVSASPDTRGGRPVHSEAHRSSICLLRTRPRRRIRSHSGARHADRRRSPRRDATARRQSSAMTPRPSADLGARPLRRDCVRVCRTLAPLAFLPREGLMHSPRRRDLVPVLIEQMHVRDGQPHTDTLSHPLKRAAICLAHRLADKDRKRDHRVSVATRRESSGATQRGHPARQLRASSPPAEGVLRGLEAKWGATPGEAETRLGERVSGQPCGTGAAGLEPATPGFGDRCSAS